MVGLPRRRGPGPRVRGPRDAAEPACAPAVASGARRVGAPPPGRARSAAPPRSGPRRGRAGGTGLTRRCARCLRQGVGFRLCGPRGRRRLVPHRHPGAANGPRDLRAWSGRLGIGLSRVARVRDRLRAGARTRARRRDGFRRTSLRGSAGRHDGRPLEEEYRMTYRIAVVGAGDWARRHHLPALAGDARAEIAVIVDADADRRAQAGAQFSAPTASSLDEALTGAQLDGVVVATPHSTTRPLVTAALTAGLAVLVAKPLTLTSDGKTDRRN